MQNGKLGWLQPDVQRLCGLSGRGTQTSDQTPAPFLDRLDPQHSAIRACRHTGNARGGERRMILFKLGA